MDPARRGEPFVNAIARPQTIMVDPRYPLPVQEPITPSRRVYDSSVEDERLPAQGIQLGRTTSRRKKAGEQGHTQNLQGVDILPAAPDVPISPRGPPVSYRDPYNNGDVLPARSNSNKSFAARAGGTLDNVDPLLANSIAAHRMAVIEKDRTPRSANSDQPSGPNYARNQKPIVSSYSSTSVEPASPHHSSIVTTPRLLNPPLNGKRVQPTLETNMPSAEDKIGSPLSARRGTRRQSAETSARRPEWAPDRSPLQKLEVKLNDISKEEKRARVQEAEQLLRESKAAAITTTQQSTTQRAVSERNSTRGDVLEKRTPRSRVASANEGRTYDDLERKNANRDKPQYTDVSVSQQRDKSLEYPSGSAEATQKRISRIPVRTGSQTQSQQARRRSTVAANSNYEDDRGVRFQTDGNGSASEEIIGRSDTIRGTSESRRPNNQAQASRKASRSSSNPGRDVPEQQKQLYIERLDIPQREDSAAAYGGAPDPVSGQRNRSHEFVPKYEVPPQTASGITARQNIGFGSRGDGAAREADHHGHHISELLHLNRHKSEQPGAAYNAIPRHLDDWRTGGVARLALADLTSNEEISTTKNTWWERDGLGSQRRGSAGQRGELDSVIKDGSQEAGNGMVQISSSDHSAVLSTPGVRVRNYIGTTESLLKGHRLHWLRQPASIIGLYRCKSMQRTLSSFYSYSCPELAEHDPSHLSHICKPYMSKELTRSMRSIRVRVPAVPTTFDPPLFLKCGPLLRYTGLKRDKLEQPGSRGASVMERETWRGSVMIVTIDSESTYSPIPTLRLFHQPMDLLPPPPQQVDGVGGEDLPSEYVDPIAGLPKMTRSGGTVYVKPVEDLDEGVDVSRIEDDDGLYEVTRTANVPTGYGKADELLGRSPHPILNKNKASQTNNRRPGKFQEVKAVRLHAERGVTFWRFNLEVELGDNQARIAYRINKAASIGFWVPARGQSMNIMFHSCNGFSLSVNPADFSGPDPLWRDVLNTHQTRPFHVMLGGGDQIYNDAVMRQTTLFQEWLNIKNPLRKHEAKFTPEMQNELETFYLERYSMWFSQGLFGMANSQIPMVNLWDDHDMERTPERGMIADRFSADIIDGFGSYPHHFMSTPVFSGLGSIAFKYYMLFQHQSVVDEITADEPSWLLGASPGPYINELSRSLFMFLGKNIAFLGLDCRTERMREEILSGASYDLAFERCRREIVRGETKHLIVLLGVPIAYPRLVWLENILTSRVMDPIKAIGRMGMLGGFLNQFDGGVEILDDLDDHWTAKNHKEERNWFVEKLQDLAAEKSVRITILGGDVHLAAIGQFYSNPKLGIPKDQDPRYMPNVISSAIVNTPPPEMMGDILNKRNKVHHLDHDTDEDMIPMFTHDVNGKVRNNKRLLPRRNWCSITEYLPGSTPPPTPPLSSSGASEEFLPQAPPNRLQRTLSLTRGDSRPGNLFRRLSLSQRRPSSPAYTPDEYHSPSAQAPPNRTSSDDYFTSQTKPTGTSTNGLGLSRNVSAPLPTRPISSFHRRPTNLSEKAALKGGVINPPEINLEFGLDIKLNCEVHQKDPAGCTVPYRLLVPALWYRGGVEGLTAQERKPSLLKRLGSLRGPRGGFLRQGAREWGGTQSETGSESEGEAENVRYGPGKLTKRNLSLRRNHNDTQSNSQNHDHMPSPITANMRTATQGQHQTQNGDTDAGSGGGYRYGNRQSASPRVTSPQSSGIEPGNPLMANYQAVVPPQRKGSKIIPNTSNATAEADMPVQRTRGQFDTGRNNKSFGASPGAVDEADASLQRVRSKLDTIGSYKSFGTPPAIADELDIPISRTRSKFDANGNSKFFGSPPPDSSPTELSGPRRGSKFDTNGNSKFFGTANDVHSGGGGGYNGIEAYKDNNKVWDKLFRRGSRRGE
ncbi:hypothetical protein MMC11_000154 [Xylographa trunciseda]|nr:hypothetical protein [Xylographa trunciseda]